jgi:hypothetical protein
MVCIGNARALCTAIRFLRPSCIPATIFRSVVDHGSSVEPKIVSLAKDFADLNYPLFRAWPSSALHHEHTTFFTVI